jgi:WhiB family redox-sensing transcriptional regulator
VADTTRLPAPLVEHWQWQLQAACQGMDSSLFFHPANERNTDRENRISVAKQICRRCPATADCLDHALRAREPYGIWGGLSEDERAQRLGIESLRYPAPHKPNPTLPGADTTLTK